MKNTIALLAGADDGGGSCLGVGIGGFGAIGMDVGRTLDAGDIPGMYLAAVSANDQSGAAARMADYETGSSYGTVRTRGPFGCCN